MLSYFAKHIVQPTKHGYEYKSQHTFEKRAKETKDAKTQYPNKLPLIIEKSDTIKNQQLKYKKFLLSKDITVGQLIYILRKEITLDATQGLYLLIKGSVIPKTSDMICNLYDKYADDDGFLYITYDLELFYG